MWLPYKLYELFQVSKESVDHLREELAGVRVERDLLKTQLQSSQGNFEWLRLRVNVLETERAQLIKLAYGIDTPVPEVVRHSPVKIAEMNSALFEDMGDEAAKKLGLPVYS